MSTLSDYHEELDAREQGRRAAFLKLRLPINLKTYEDSISSCLDWKISQLTLARKVRLEIIFRQKYPDVKSHYCLLAATAIASWVQELESRLTHSDARQKSHSRSSAKDLSRLIKVARSGDVTKWAELWPARTASVKDLIGLVQRLRDKNGQVDLKPVSMEQCLAALKPGGAVPEGRMRGINGFLIETPQIALPWLLEARTVAAKRGRRTHWFEKLVLVEIAGWLSILTEARVRQPSKLVGDSERRGPLVTFLEHIERVCGDETTFFQSLRRSGLKFQCLGSEGVLRTVD